MFTTWGFTVALEDFFYPKAALHLQSISEHSLQPLQLIPNLPFAQVRHSHDLHHQACPACEMLRSLAKSCLGVVLLPREACSFPVVEDVLYKNLAELGVKSGRAGFVGALGLG